MKKSDAYKLWAVISILKDELDDKTANGGTGGNNGEDVNKLIAPELAHETTFVEVNPAFIAYVKAAFILLHKAFGNKKGHRFIAIR